MSRATNQMIAAGLSQGLQNFVTGYTARKDAELKEQREAAKRAERLKRVQEVTNDPNASPIMLANAVSSLSADEQKAYMPILQQNAKTQARISTLQGFAAERPDLFPELQPTQAPGVGPTGIGGQMVNQMAPQVRPLMQQFEQPTPQNALGAAQAMTQNRQPIGDQAPTGHPLTYAQRAERARLLNQAGLTNEARLEVAQIQNDVKREAAEQKAAATREAALRKERFEIHKSFQGADLDIEKGARSAHNRVRAFNTMRKGLASGKLNPRTFENLVRTTLKGTRWENYFKNKEVAEFEAAALESYEGMKDLFGVRLSDADLQLASGKVPDPSKSAEANAAIIDFLEFKDQMRIAEQEITDEIKAENGGYRPIDYTAQIRRRMQEQHGEKAERLVKAAAYEGRPTPEPTAEDPLIESAYGPIPEGRLRAIKGSEVIAIPKAMTNSARADGWTILGE